MVKLPKSSSNKAILMINQDQDQAYTIQSPIEQVRTSNNQRQFLIPHSSFLVMNLWYKQRV